MNSSNNVVENSKVAATAVFTISLAVLANHGILIRATNGTDGLSATADMTIKYGPI